jgi:predicted PurR-regulated permease PerM
MEKRWSLTTKRIIIVGSVIALFMLISRARAVLSPLAITCILAYILSPVADFVSARLRLNRTLVVVIIYLILVAIILVIPAMFIPYLIQKTENLVEDIPGYAEGVGEFFQKPLIFGDVSVEVQDVYEQVSSSIEGLLTSLTNQTINILSNIATALLWTFFVLVASFYLVKDADTILRWFDEAVPPDYRHDVRQIRLQIAASWNAFLRGQLILCVAMGVIVGATMALIGLPNAWLIGLLFGFLEFIPNFGPTIATIPTVFIAFFQGSTVLDISNGWFAVVVIVVSFVLQQLENSLLVPRIMGQSLNLHPLVVLIGAMVGAHLAGVLGILLAAPVIATLRVLAEYTYYRLLDMPPFPELSSGEQKEGHEEGTASPEAVTKNEQATPPVEEAKAEQLA